MTDKHILAIKLMNDGYSDKQLVEALNLHINVVRQWRRDPSFLRERYVDMCLRFGELGKEAIDTLRDVMNNKDGRGADRIKAATEILDRAGFVIQREVKISVTDNSGNNDMSKLTPQEIRIMLSEVQETRRLMEIEAAKDVTPKDILQIDSSIEGGAAE